MKALSIRQPWADAILLHGKDIENRTWSTTYRGPLLIHAAKMPDRDDAYEFIARATGQFSENSIPMAEHFGGIIGIVDLVDVVTTSKSPWFTLAGCGFGWVLKNPRRLPFHRVRGQLGLFDVPHFSAT